MQFANFMRGLSADARLGRYVAPLADQTPEVIVLHLVRALADCAVGNQSHPALELLARLEDRR